MLPKFGLQATPYAAAAAASPSLSTQTASITMKCLAEYILRAHIRAVPIELPAPQTAAAAAAAGVSK